MFLSIILTLLTILQYAMLFAALASWIPQFRQSKIGYYLHLVTEPVVTPFRLLLGKISFTRDLPVDISFLLAFWVLQMLMKVLR